MSFLRPALQSNEGFLCARSAMECGHEALEDFGQQTQQRDVGWPAAQGRLGALLSGTAALLMISATAMAEKASPRACPLGKTVLDSLSRGCDPRRSTEVVLSPRRRAFPASVAAGESWTMTSFSAQLMSTGCARCSGALGEQDHPAVISVV